MQRVCVLGAEVRQALFAFHNPLGQQVKIQDEWFQVIGILENKHWHSKSSAIQTDNLNKRVYIPLSTS